MAQAPLEQLLLFPPTVVPTGRADGAFLIIPGKPILQEEQLTVSQVAKLTGYSKRRIRELAIQLGARQHSRKCKLFIPASMVSRFTQLKAQ